MKTIYVSCESKADILPAMKKARKKLCSYERIGLVSSAQHLKALAAAKDFLDKEGKKPVMGGQVLGCNIENAERIEEEVDAFLFIGSGRFHPTALYALKKPLLTMNPYSGAVEEITEKQTAEYAKKKIGRVMKAAEAKAFGVLVSTKTGQFNLKKAEELKSHIESRGKKAYLFSGQEINPARLMGYGIDAWVNTACPRIAEDEFDKPMLAPEEVKTLLGD